MRRPTVRWLPAHHNFLVECIDKQFTDTVIARRFADEFGVLRSVEAIKSYRRDHDMSATARDIAPAGARVNANAATAPCRFVDAGFGAGHVLRDREFVRKCRGAQELRAA